MYKSLYGIILCILFVLTGCTQENVISDTIPSQSGQSVEASGPAQQTATARFEILDVREEGILVFGSEDCKGLYYVDQGGESECVEEDKVPPSDLKPGIMVDLTWDGMVMESYPARFQYDGLKIAGGSEKPELSFYLQLIKDLAEVDPGLNDDISECYFDFTDITSLNNGEKEGLAYLCGNFFGCMGVLSTKEELWQNGILDREKGLEHGILITVKETSRGNGQLTCNAEKYRSGTGAYYFNDVTASYKDGAWSYKIGSQAIS